MKLTIHRQLELVFFPVNWDTSNILKIIEVKAITKQFVFDEHVTSIVPRRIQTSVNVLEGYKSTHLF